MKTMLLAVVAAVACVVTLAAYDQKPIYHIAPENGHWINDPNGPFYDDNTGLYHLFAQYNPSSAIWGNMSWYHWTSKDMVSWNRLGVAIGNDESYDIGGAFSGSTVMIPSNQGTGKIPMLVYTCVDIDNNERQCTAIPSDPSDTQLITWQKSSTNPLLDFTSLPSGWNSLQFRDPSVWPASNSDKLWALFAAEIGSSGTAALYSCDASMSHCDFYNTFWNSTSPTSTYQTYMVECPDFYTAPVSSELSKSRQPHYIFKFSVMEERRDLYEVGFYKEDLGTFVRDVQNFPSRLEYDYGPNNNFYASKTFWDSKVNDRVLWGWSPEQDDPNSIDRNWSGVMALPRTVIMDYSLGALRFEPVSALKSLRDSSSHVTWKHRTLPTTSTTSGQKTVEMNIEDVEVLATEVLVVFKVIPGSVGVQNGCEIEVGVKGRTDKQINSKTFTTHSLLIGTNQTIVNENMSSPSSIASTTVRTKIDSSHSGGTSPSIITIHEIPGNLKELTNGYQRYSMHLFYDHSIVEMYALQGASASTTRVYPDQSMTGLTLFAALCSDHDVVEVESFDAWNMKPIWS